MSSQFQYHRLKSTTDENEMKPWTCLHINFKLFTFATCSLPLLAFGFCIGYAWIYHFARSTYTDCGAQNVLPSISAAIGGFSPEREVWKVAIALDFPPRLVLIYIYFKYDNYSSGRKVIYIRSLLMVIENLALLLLTYYDSTYNYAIHSKSFTIFILTSLLHMLLLYYSHRRGEKIVRMKNKLAVINFLCFMLAMFFFVLHDIQCPDYAYSLFALCEYIVVLTNIAYHGSITYDFPNKYLTITWVNRLTIQLEEPRVKYILMHANRRKCRRKKKL